MRTILCIDDDESIWKSIRAIFEDSYKIFVSSDVPQARELLKSERIDLILLDQALPGTDGLTFLNELAKLHSEIPVLMVTAGDLEYTLGEALRRGARGLITKPFNVREIRHFVHQALSTLDAPKVRAALEKASDTVHLSGIIDAIASHRAVARGMELMRVNAPLFITGEKGVGKELLARHLHATHSRPQDLFYLVRCSAEEKELERELFGEEEGPGVLQTMSGVIFFDNVNLLPGTVKRRLGEVIAIKAPPQAPILIFGTSSPASFLEGAATSFVEISKTRVVEIPPLRERSEDVPVLAYRFLTDIAKRFGSPLTSFSAEAIRYLRAYAWPGNVRELENVVERLVIIYGEYPEVEASILPREICPIPPKIPQFPGLTMDEAMESFEKGMLLDALDRAGGNAAKAAELLAISPRRVGTRLHALKTKGHEGTPV